uniref:Uncharacterized protein n=1 Tax=Knipowitschia caucasica TaxID=637954 RepID=A0AAV2MIZ1_KNICA
MNIEGEEGGVLALGADTGGETVVQSSGLRIRGAASARRPPPTQLITIRAGQGARDHISANISCVILHIVDFSSGSTQTRVRVLRTTRWQTQIWTGPDGHTEAPPLCMGQSWRGAGLMSQGATGCM